MDGGGSEDYSKAARFIGSGACRGSGDEMKFSYGQNQDGGKFFSIRSAQGLRAGKDGSGKGHSATQYQRRRRHISRRGTCPPPPLLRVEGARGGTGLEELQTPSGKLTI